MGSPICSAQTIVSRPVSPKTRFRPGGTIVVLAGYAHRPGTAMTIKIKLLIAGFVLIGAVAYLAGAGMKSGWVYYLEVDKFLSDPQYHGQRVRLHGKVDAADFKASPGSLTASFKLSGHTNVVPVVYHGQIPDQFQVGRDVVVEGRLDNNAVFKADVLLTKCASKYEAGSPHAKAPHANA